LYLKYAKIKYDGRHSIKTRLQQLNEAKSIFDRVREIEKEKKKQEMILEQIRKVQKMSKDINKSPTKKPWK
jgi:hemerythrin superfamily protein